MTVTVKDMLEAGSHFGHQSSRWNPKMRQYIFATKGGIHILDLEQTVVALHKACQYVTETVARGQSVLFVGTKPQAKPVIEAEATRSNQYYINNRWLGGLLTNFKTIRASIQRLKDLEEKTKSADFEKYVKKERVEMEREIKKLNAIFFGIKTMPNLPGCIFLIDPNTENIAQREAARLKIPTIAIVDTNCDPEGIDFCIPANDDALRSIQLITQAIADAALEGLKQRELRIAKEESEAAQQRLEREKEPTARKLVKEHAVEGKAKAFVGGKLPKPGDKVEVVDDADLKKYSSTRVG